MNSTNFTQATPKEDATMDSTTVPPKGHMPYAAIGALICAASTLLLMLTQISHEQILVFPLLTVILIIVQMVISHRKQAQLSQILTEIKSAYSAIEAPNTPSLKNPQWQHMDNLIHSWWQDTQKSRFYLQALDACQGNIMVADTQYNIVYRNPSLHAMFKENEQRLKPSLPRLSVDDMIGANMDMFHHHPAHQRQLMDNMTKAYRSIFNVEGLTFRLTATPIFRDKQRIGTVIEWLDMTAQVAKEKAEQALSAENARIKQALDCVSANTMVADNNNDIIYTNHALQAMFEEAQEDVRSGLPNFNAKKLVGENIDVFHKNPVHQHHILQRLKTTHHAQFEVGKRFFKFTANPIKDAQNKRIGTVVEWEDRTSEVHIEAEVNRLVAAANRGDLSDRLSLDNKEGFFLTLSQGLNRLLTVSDTMISDVVELFDGLAKGDLGCSLSGEYEGQFDKLQRDANATVSRLTQVLSEIRETANTVTVNAEEITQGNVDLSQRTEEQAASLEETAASMEQMTSTVKQSENNAALANQLAQEACSKAELGGKVVKQAVSAMDEITQSSKRIADIISVIDEIAFQTNLLALNAAVEAARAGEQGRGFAVVAGEVRNLAQRSAGAAKEIKALINDSVDKVTDGTTLVNQSGDTLKDIMSSVSKVAEMISHISIAAQQQSVGILEVNKSVSQMDLMTQQNAALVEQISAAGDTMTEQAHNMKQKLNFFNTGQDFSTHSRNAIRPQISRFGSKKEQWHEF
ncbi:methyl-accepting chemotaxis protein [Shewanella intestini]|uniref:Chemotaxis protein n=1 Tax=Shewanella intestini TaxID=2017544 RepID=A0ABS5I212_9GAMM|nr:MULTISPECIES: methyl-accepting chemotaxis protein [Shewanella]MBR9728068.1 chemotaxis protein [Shewanella intestini]MRG36540.1 chemotaxis protein [Shewanella sp. XMDDZSB0408]